MNSSDIMTKRGIAWFFLYPFNLLNQIILRFSLRYGGAQAKEVERFLKFSVVGIIGAVIDFGVLNVLQMTALSPVEPHLSLKVALATGTAFTSAVTSNFIWNRYWTYPDSRSRSIQQQLVQFFIVNAAGLVFRLIWVRVLFGPLGEVGTNTFAWLGVVESMDDTATKQLGTNIAQFFAIWIVMIWNFFVNRYWTYNDVE
jgi:putative flippase GtrA